jgi:two-component system NtrC family sensor kinase
MKKIAFTLALLALFINANAQRKVIDSLRAALSKTTVDTTRMNILKNLGNAYFISRPDSSIIFGQQAYELAVKYNDVLNQAKILNSVANAYATIGDYVKSLQFYFKSLRINEQVNNTPGIVTNYNNIGATYTESQDYDKALPYLKKAQKMWAPYMLKHQLKTRPDKLQADILLINIAECFLYTNRIDSADHYLQTCYADSKKKHFSELIANLERDLGEVELARKHKETALTYLRHAIQVCISTEDVETLSISYLSMAKLYHQYQQPDSAKFYAKKALETAQSQKYQQDALNAAKVLYNYYDQEHNLPEAYKYYKLAMGAKDSLYSQDKVRQVLSLDFEEKQRQQEIAAAQEQYRASVRMYSLITGMVLLVVLAFIFWRANKARTKAYNLLHKQKEEIDFQKAKVEHTLAELKSTQNQLVQSAKMASLGELTAGIAHEIQNPLNFVNNFSEVNTELIDEMQEEIGKGHYDEVKTIAEDLKTNQQKISQHGKRADFIVKGMLEHSRISTGERQITDINVLADEFLKLSYHGLRAKDKGFNAELVTNFDSSLPKVNVVQQDIGRVLINLFGNAFYAVNEKAKAAGLDYKPTVEVSTARQNGSVLVKVKDNGDGIPESIKDKIMQPFFTTKPTGEGTGLGLSLSYDIVVKGHGGEIDVDTKEGEGSEFVVRLPTN